MFANYFKTAFRYLLRNRLHSFINIAGLSIGIASAIVISVFVQYESGFDSFHEKSATTFKVVQQTKFQDQTLYWGSTCYPLAAALRSDFPEFSNVTQTAGPHTRVVAVDRGAAGVFRYEEEFTLYADTEFTSVFDIGWLAGSKTEALKSKNSVILTEDVAAKCFGTGDDYTRLLGKVIMLNGKDPLTVTGVVKNAPGNTSIRYGIIVPYEFFAENNKYQATNWSGNYAGRTFVVLDPARKLSAEGKIASWKKKYLKPDDDARISYVLQPITEVHNDTVYGTSKKSYSMPSNLLRSATLIGIIILVIAAVNFVNLTTATASTRSKEIGIRKVLGTSRGRLIAQFLYEHTLLIFLTLAVSIGLSQVALNYLNAFLTSINLQLAFRWEHVSTILLIALLAIAMAAIYPAFVLSAFRPIEAIKNKLNLERVNIFSLRRFLIVTQFAIVQLLIIATIVVAMQVREFKGAELGFDKTSIVHLPVPSYEQRDAFRNLLLENKDITEVTFGSTAPMPVDASFGTSYRLPHEPETEGKEAEMNTIDVNYLSLFNLQLIAGRNISTVKNRFDEFVVNEKLVTSMGWTPEQALGQKLMINEGEATIVGVVKDFHNESLQNEILPCVMMNWDAILISAYIKCATTSPEVLRSIEASWKQIAPEGVYRYSVLEDAIIREYEMEDLVFYGFIVFSALAIIIGCLGLFGLSSFMALRRSKEIGIRKVFGASLSQIVSRFSQEFVWMVLIAFVLAAPIAYLLMEAWLTEFVYRIDISWWMLAAGGATGLIVAITTVSFHSFSAAQASPAESLRSE